MLSRLADDATAAVRALRRNPRLTLVMVFTLALGLGANTAIFSIVRSVLFVDADFGRSSGRVISLHSIHPSRAQQLDDAHLSREEFDLLRSAVPELARIEGYVFRSFTLEVTEGAIRASGASITPGLFDLIDARPALGRTFRDEDAHDFGFETTVVLSDALWQRQYGGDPAIVGRGIRLNGRQLEVVGVMPKGFGFPVRQELWLPYKPETPGSPSARFLQTVALLKSGETLDNVSARLEPLSLDLERRLPETHRDYRLRAAAFPLSMVGNAPQSMTALLLAVTMVLLIACANLAGLLLARSVDRRREIALKAALGASRRSLVRELLVEVFALSVAGAALGWAFAAWAVPRVVGAIPEPPPYWMRFDVDGTAFLYCLSLTFLTTLAAGLVPALRSASIDLSMDLRDSGRSSTRGVRTRVLTEGIVATQVGVCLALVVAAQLMILSFTNIQKADAGVREEGLLTLRLYLSGDEVDGTPAKARALARFVEGIEARPSVIRAAVTTAIPADDGGPTAMIVVDVAAPPTEEIPATVVGASDGLFESIGKGLLRGRDFSRQEFEDPEAKAVLVSASLASSLGLGPDVVGRTVALREGTTHDWRTIVGVVPDVQYEEFGEETRALRRAVYVPYARLGWRSLAVMARTGGSAEPLVRELRSIARAAYPGIALFEVRTMTEVRETTTWGERFLARTMAFLALSAMLLAGVGLYALLRQFVGARTHEIGVRRALGASRRAIVALVVSRAGLVAGSGVLLGALLSTLVARVLAGLLFGVSPMSAPTFVGASGAILLLVVGCSWVPVRRAVSVDPIVTLREE